MASAVQYSFGSGVLFGTSNVNAVPTPVRFGGLQDVSIDFAFTTKPLYGQYQFPIAIGRGTAKVTGKAKWAQINAQAYNDLFFGSPAGPTTGEIENRGCRGANSHQQQRHGYQQRDIPV